MSSTREVDARQNILRRIRAANSGETALAAASRDWDRIPRSYACGTQLSTHGVLELLMDRLRDYGATVDLVEAGHVAAAVREILRGRGNPRMLIAAGFSTGLLPDQSGFTLDDNFSAPDLDRFDGIVTEATLAIAETGTLVLQSVPGQGRRAPTLVPDFHLCVARSALVVESVPEAVRLLAATATLPTTFVSGPSATADIEMTRIQGVHGPRSLHVVLAR